MSPQQKAQIAARLARVEAERLHIVSADGPIVGEVQIDGMGVRNVLTDECVNGERVLTVDRHKPGYMAKYMRKRRAK